MSFDNTIPHDLHAEESMMATACYRPDLAAEIGRTLHPEDFYRPDHQAVWAAFQYLQRFAYRRPDAVRNGEGSIRVQRESHNAPGRYDDLYLGDVS